MPRGKYNKKPNPNASYRRVFRSNHYKEKGLAFEDYLRLAQQPCHYCKAEPVAVNPYGATYEMHRGAYKQACTEAWWQERWIKVDGIDKKEPTKDYTDLSNLVPCCKTCNWMKHLLPYQTFLNQIAKIAAIFQPELETTT